MVVSRGVGLMPLINRAFIGRPYIAPGDSHVEVADTLARLPLMVAIQTHYVPATDNEAARILATCKGTKRFIGVPYAYEHNRSGVHYVAAVALLRRDLPDKWENLAVLGAIEHGGGFLFCFGEDGLNT